MAETPEKSGSTQTEKDRRIKARQRIHSLSYVEIGKSNGGIVLNISEGGISVQAATVLEQGETVAMRIQIPRARKKLEVNGEIVWLSASRKEAGLRFIDLLEESLHQIRQWMAREASPEKFEDENDLVDGDQVDTVEVKQQEKSEIDERIEANGDIDVAVEEGGESEADVIEEFAAEDSEEIEEAEEVEEMQAQQEEEEIEELEERASPIASNDAKEETEREPETVTEAAAAREEEIQDEPETEDELIAAFGPPVVPFERKPPAPFSEMNAMSGPRGSQNIALAAALPLEVRNPFAEVAARPEAASSSGWKDFRVQLQTGWFLAALVLLLALISFIAGMAVRRGALNGVMGEKEDTVVPRSAPAPTAGTPLTGSTASAEGAVSEAVAKPLSIEVVDLANHRWVIPATAGGNRAASNGAGETAPTSTSNGVANPAANREAGSEPNAKVSSVNSPAAAANGAGTEPAAKPSAPLMLSLPETPISASGSVAISSQRSVPVPADAGQSAQSGRNLQVGQLINLVEPVYPAEAVQQKIEGTVKLHAVVGVDGAIQSLTPLSGAKPLMDASIAAVRNWKYSPTRMNGMPIETQEDISFVFRLPN